MDAAEPLEDALARCRAQSPAHTLRWNVVERVSALDDNDLRVLDDFLSRLGEAEVKHPCFAVGPYEALGVVTAEHDELVRAVETHEGAGRMRDEALDVCAVAWRFVRGDYG